MPKGTMLHTCKRETVRRKSAVHQMFSHLAQETPPPEISEWEK